MEFLLYITKVNIAIVILYLLYKIAFQNDTMFVLKRVVLLFSLAFVFVYPLLDFVAVWMASFHQNEVLPALNFTTFIFNAQPETVVYVVSPETTSTLSFAQMAIHALIILYCIGVAVCIGKFIAQLISISQLIFSARKTNVNGIDVLVSNRDISPFSFFGRIIISEKTYADAELHQILLHEQTHVRQWHSVDVMLSELFCIFNWFNPLAWKLKREIRLNLEYLADGAVITKGCDITNYQLNLVRLSYQNNELTITNNFNFSPLKKRILMMQKMKTPTIGLAKYLLIVPVAIALMMCTANTSPEPEMVEEVIVEVLYEVTERAAHDVETEQSELTEEVHEFTEERPEFPGGEAALMRWLNYHIRYPVEAMQQGISGTVMVQFVIERDGSITNATIVRSPDPSLGREALRIINLMPNWHPGRHNGNAVRARFTLPVIFRLESPRSE